MAEDLVLFEQLLHICSSSHELQLSVQGKMFKSPGESVTHTHTHKFSMYPLRTEDSSVQ